MISHERRSELADFLRTRRSHLSPTDVGLPRTARRKTAGLRREEVAQLASVGVTWYTWLEQGRDITVSIQVLESLAQTFKLTPAEKAHLFLLAGQASPVHPVPQQEHVSPFLSHFLEQMGTNPAYITGRRCGLVGLFRRRRSWNLTHVLLIGNRAHILERGMSTNPIVKTFPLFKDVLSRLLPTPILMTFHTFALERAEETFHCGVVVAVT